MKERMVHGGNPKVLNESCFIKKKKKKRNLGWWKISSMNNFWILFFKKKILNSYNWERVAFEWVINGAFQ